MGVSVQLLPEYLLEGQPPLLSLASCLLYLLICLGLLLCLINSIRRLCQARLPLMPKLALFKSWYILLRFRRPLWRLLPKPPPLLTCCLLLQAER